MDMAIVQMCFRGFNAAASLKLAAERQPGDIAREASAVLMPRPH